MPGESLPREQDTRRTGPACWRQSKCKIADTEGAAGAERAVSVVLATL
jgi:hypothetical protein